jgi:hypothetical protein
MEIRKRLREAKKKAKQEEKLLRRQERQAMKNKTYPAELAESEESILTAQDAVEENE